MKRKRREEEGEEKEKEEETDEEEEEEEEGPEKEERSQRTEEEGTEEEAEETDDEEEQEEKPSLGSLPDHTVSIDTLSNLMDEEEEEEGSEKEEGTKEAAEGKDEEEGTEEEAEGKDGEEGTEEEAEGTDYKEEQEEEPSLGSLPDHTDSTESILNLMDKVSKIINNLKIPTKSASSPSGSLSEPSIEQLQKALTELKDFSSLSVDEALLDDATLFRFKQASRLLVHRPDFLGEAKCNLLRNHLSQLDYLVQSLHISIQKDRGTLKLKEKKMKLIDKQSQYKGELLTCSLRMGETMLKYQKMKEELRAVKAEMISQKAHLHRLLSQNNKISQEFIEITKIEELLQNQTRESASFRQRAEDGWRGLSLDFTEF